jgi:DNA modification methylase
MKIKFAKLLLARPELKEQLKTLPMRVAMRRATQIQETERVQRLSTSGMLKLSADVRHGDARELIKLIPDASIDLVLTDPPFGIPPLDEMEGKDRGTVQSYTSVLKPADNATAREVHALMLELAPQLVRVLKPGGHVYVFFAFELEQALRQSLEMAGLVVNPVPLIWDKGMTTAPFRGYDYAPCYEPVMFGYKPPRTRRLTEPCQTILRGFTPDRAELKVHPFQKPLALMRYFIKQSTFLGQRVLDPFVGSGSTVLAARACGRTGIGFELDEERFHQAQSRLLKGDIGGQVSHSPSAADEALSAADEAGET